METEEEQVFIILIYIYNIVFVQIIRRQSKKRQIKMISDDEDEEMAEVVPV